MKTKILLVGIDGLLLKTAISSGRAPALSALKDAGFFSEMVIQPPTWSGPGWATLLTGSTHGEHGVTDNRFMGHRLLHRPDLLSLAFYQDQTTTTFAAAGWPPLVDPSGLGPIIHERREQQMAYKHRVIARDGETHGYQKADSEVAHAALYALTMAGPDVNFVYFCDADEAAHQHGVLGDHYLAAIERIDSHLAKLEQAVRDRSANFDENWLLVVTTDHGHIAAGGHGGDSDQERSSFVIAVGIGRGNPNWEIGMKPESLTRLILAERSNSQFNQ